MHFVHLDVSSRFGLSDGMVDPAVAVAFCQETGMSALALTDPGTMLGSPSLLKACLRTRNSAHPVKPIFGCAIRLHPGNAAGWVHPTDAWGRPWPGWRLVLLAQNAEGYANLCRIVSAGFRNGYTRTPLVGLRHVMTHTNGILALSGGRAGEVSTCLRRDDLDGAFQAARNLRELFGEGFYLQAHPSDTKIHEGLQSLSSRLGMPVVATQEARYLNRSDAESQALIRRKRFRTRDSHPSVGSYHLATPTEMAEAFPLHPEWLANSLKIAERIASIDPRPEPMLAMASDIADLRTRAKAGLRARLGARCALPDIHPYLSRLEGECDQIERMGCVFPFLAWAALARTAGSHGVDFWLTQGSPCQSLVAWALGLSDIDPLEVGLGIPIFQHDEGVEWFFELHTNLDEVEPTLASLLPEAFPGMNASLTNGMAFLRFETVNGDPAHFGRRLIIESAPEAAMERLSFASEPLLSFGDPSAIAPRISTPPWGPTLQVPIHQSLALGLLPMRVMRNRTGRNRFLQDPGSPCLADPTPLAAGHGRSFPPE